MTTEQVEQTRPIDLAIEKSMFGSVVGSQAWNMARPDSDEDRFYVFAHDLPDLLRGTTGKTNYHEAQYLPGVDVSVHEVGKVVDMLVKGNINFVMGMTSPLVTISNGWGTSLSKLTKETIATNVCDSVLGMTAANVKKYASRGPTVERMKAPKMVRVLRFAEGIVSGNGFHFDPVSECGWDTVREAVKDLELARSLSTLPETPDEDSLRDWLLEYRLVSAGYL